MTGCRKGFTLIEMLVVSLILAILTSIALPNYRRSVERARIAEAQTLLRSIYDSCERLAWENREASCLAAVPSGSAVFAKLDITVKGRFSGATLTTENFLYTIAGNGSVSATPVKGSYANAATIVFDGRLFTCTPNPSAACTAWGASTWNQQ